MIIKEEDIDRLEITPVRGEFITLIPFEPTRLRQKGLKKTVYTDRWGKVVIYGRETMNSFDLKVLLAFSYLLWEKIKKNETYNAGEMIYRWKEDDEYKEEKLRLIGITTTMSNFLKNYMHITHSKSNSDIVWESFLRYEGTVWVFHVKRKTDTFKITSKIIYGIRQTNDGLTIITSERYRNTIQKMNNVLGVANRLVQSIKNDTAALLSVWLQGKPTEGTFFFTTIAEAIRIPKDRRMSERIRKAFDELQKVGQIEKYEIIKENSRRAETWKIHYRQNPKLISAIKIGMHVAKQKALKKD